jgi:Ca2+-binding EF-hand superfamily protein
MTIANIRGHACGRQNMEAVRLSRFKKIDQDGDGKITKDELKAALPRDGRGPSVDDIFSKVDTNQDGVIDQAEDKAAVQQMRQAHQGHHHGPPRGAPEASKMATNIFKFADTDTDGKITKSEMSTAFEKVGVTDSNSSMVDELFKAADQDGDGVITQAELTAFLEKMQQANQPPPPPPPNDSGSSDTARQGTVASTDQSFSAVA